MPFGFQGCHHLFLQDGRSSGMCGRFSGNLLTTPTKNLFVFNWLAWRLAGIPSGLRHHPIAMGSPVERSCIRTIVDNARNCVSRRGLKRLQVRRLAASASNATSDRSPLMRVAFGQNTPWLAFHRLFPRHYSCVPFRH